MKNTFFLMQEGNKDWFQLVIKDNLFSMSCGSLEDVKESLHKIVLRYKTRAGLDKALKKMEQKPRLSEWEKTQKESYLKERGDEYESLVYEVVTQALNEIILGSSITKIRKRLLPKALLTAKESSQESTSPQKDVQEERGNDSNHIALKRPLGIRKCLLTTD